MITRDQLIDALDLALTIIRDNLPDQPGLITLHQTLEKAKVRIFYESTHRLPEPVFKELRKASQICAEAELHPDLETVQGPGGEKDKLTTFGIDTKFGNCTVKIEVVRHL